MTPFVNTCKGASCGSTVSYTHIYLATIMRQIMPAKSTKASPIKLDCCHCSQQVGSRDRESYIAQLTTSSTESWTVFSLPGCAMVLSLTGLQSITVGVHISSMVSCEYITIITQTIQTSTVNEKYLLRKYIQSPHKQTFSYTFP